jgi:hypothetical protein
VAPVCRVCYVATVMMSELRTGAPPPNHSKFTELSFVHPTKLPSNSQRMQQLGESEKATEEATADVTGSTRAWTGITDDRDDEGGWLESDDIRDF